MATIVAVGCISGAVDLYYGAPDLCEAVVVRVEQELDDPTCTTTLVLQDKKGREHKITLRPFNSGGD